MEVKQSQTNNDEAKLEKRDNTKIYFFIIAIVALLMTNVYFYVKFKSSGEKLYTVALQKENLQIEIDRIEAELDVIKSQNAENLPTELLQEEEGARETIAKLRGLLETSNISEKELQNARDQIQRLKINVTTLKSEAGELKLQNEILKKENDQLNQTVVKQESQVQNLKDQNTSLNKKVTIASSIKVSNIIVNGVEKNRKDEYEIETKAKRVDNLQIKFTIADNPLAQLGEKEVFVRVIDPQGNLIAKSNNVFSVHGDKTQYTFKETITFTNKGEEYELLWKDVEKFKKGAYTVLVYADSAIMGRSSVVLK